MQLQGRYTALRLVGYYQSFKPSRINVLTTLLVLEIEYRELATEQERGLN